MGQLQGRRAAITAGAGGLGLVIAKLFRAAGATVFVCDVDAAALAALPDGIAGARVDVASEAEVDGWLGPIVAEGIDILINNAGIAGPTGLIEDLSLTDWRRCIEVVLDSQFLCSRAVMPAMKKARAGAIVNLSSTAGIMGFPLRSPYCAAKYAVIGLTKTLAMEAGRDNVRVNAIAPGSINGDRMARVIKAHAEADGITEDAVRRLYTEGTSMATFVDPEEIADMILYLVSDKGKRISGQVIAVDGHTETLICR